MAWQDRIREAAYTSPNGTRITFGFEDVSKNFEKKTTGFDFPDADGTYVQDLGHSGRRYPLRIFFTGADHDLDADSFEALLTERGVGRLDHPFYGVKDVVPFGTITRRDDLKSAANQTVFEVTFWETIGLIYPTAQTDASSEVLSAVDSFNENAAAAFADSVVLTTAFERAALRNNFSTLLDGVEGALQSVANTQDNVRSQFDAIKDSINSSITTLIGDPVTLALQTINLIQTPALVASGVQARLNGYANLIASVAERADAIAPQGSDRRTINRFYARDLFLTTDVTGAVVSSVNSRFETKPQAIEAADLILSQFDSVVAWRDSNFDNLGEVDTGAAYQSLLDTVAIAAGFLVEISFSLKQERVLVLDRARTIIDLVAELYGTVDDELDFFIKSNSLSGSEILELPRGRRLVYFV